MRYKIYSNDKDGFTKDQIAVLLDFMAKRKPETFGDLCNKKLYEGYYYEIEFESIYLFNEFVRIMNQLGYMLLLTYLDNTINITICTSAVVD